MKKKAIGILLALVLVVSLAATASADSFEGSKGWTVTFTPQGKIVCNFTTADIQDEVLTLQPGDDITFTIVVGNLYKDSVDWYMLNTIVQSLEDGTIAENGAYSYVLTYQTSTGTVREIYNSEQVGGDISASGSVPEGLHQVNDALKEYFYLETQKPGTAGQVTLKVTLEGETQDNGYQDTLADLTMKFAAEITPTHIIIKTGDETNMLPYYIGMAVSGAVLLFLAIDGVKRRKRSGGAKA